MSEKNNNQLQTLSKRINDHLKEIYENKCRVAAIIFILLSLIFFLTMLIGSTNGSVNLNKFTFEGPISKILQRKSITFTLLGYCIDDKCTNEVSHNFDKAPTSDEIQSGEVKKRGIDIDPSDIADKVGDAANNAGEIAKDAGGKAGEIAQDAGEKAGEIAQDAGKKAGELAENVARAAVNALLSAFDNFLPKEPTNGKSGWVARPIITASIFDALALLLLLITTTNNRKYCYPSAFILLLISFILNVVSFFITFSLFSLVFNVIGAFPGIGDNETGSAIYLSGFSSVFLLIAISLIIIDGSRGKKKYIDKITGYRLYRLYLYSTCLFIIVH